MSLSQPRHRVLDLTSRTDEFLRSTNFCDGSVTHPVNNPQNVVVSGEYREMYDYVTPKYKSLQRKGVVVNNPMARNKTVFSQSLTGYSHSKSCVTMSPSEGWRDEYDSLLHYWLGPQPLLYSGLGLFSSADVESMVTDVATKALSDIKSPAVRGQVFALSLGKITRFLRNPIQGLVTLFRQYDKHLSLWKKGQLIGKAAAATHLQYIYAFRILAMNVEDIVLETLNQRVQDPRLTARGKVETTRKETSQDYFTWGGTVLRGFWYETTVKHTINIRAGLLYDWKGRTQSDIYGFSLSNIPADIWEIIPYSFVVDWVSNMGDVIRALSYFWQVDALAQWLTTTETVNINRKVTATDFPNLSGDYTRDQDSSDSDTVIYETYRRVPAALELKFGLTGRNNLNLSHSLASFSLLLQRLIR